MSDKEQKGLEKAGRVLTQKELETYQKYMESGKPGLAPSTAAGFFALFLQGHSTKEIADLNPAFGQGIILRARIEYDWDQQRDEHLQNLLANIRQVVQHTQLGAAQFLADGMAVYQRLMGEKFQRYLQSGDVKELGEFKDMSFKNYKDTLEMLQKLTGQEPQKKISGEVLHRHQVEAADGPVSRGDRPMTPSEADDFLKRLDVPKVKK